LFGLGFLVTHDDRWQGQIPSQRERTGVLKPWQMLKRQGKAVVNTRLPRSAGPRGLLAISASVSWSPSDQSIRLGVFLSAL